MTAVGYTSRTISVSHDHTVRYTGRTVLYHMTTVRYTGRTVLCHMTTVRYTGRTVLYHMTTVRYTGRTILCHMTILVYWQDCVWSHVTTVRYTVHGRTVWSRTARPCFTFIGGHLTCVWLIPGVPANSLYTLHVCAACCKHTANRIMFTRNYEH